MPKMLARLLGLGAYAVCVALLALFALVAFASRHTATGGIDPTTQHVTWLAMGGVILAIIGVHVYLGRQLMLIARENDAPQPLGAR
jgi:peptidoglycan/LPS O-acetylase OafA/YrhL